MDDRRPERLELVALVNDRPGSGLKAGQVGSVAKFLGNKGAGGAEIYWVKFYDEDGRAKEYVELRRAEFVVLLPNPQTMPGPIDARRRGGVLAFCLYAMVLEALVFLGLSQPEGSFLHRSALIAAGVWLLVGLIWAIKAALSRRVKRG